MKTKKKHLVTELGRLVVAAFDLPCPGVLVTAHLLDNPQVKYFRL